MNNETISIVDYGAANLGSICNMLRKISLPSKIVSTPEDLSEASKILLPGVGSFDHGMRALEDLGLVEPLRQKALREQAPILGVCLGMQLLGARSEEGSRSGLRILQGECVKLRMPANSNLKVPHMGWNIPTARKTSRLLENLGTKARFYFTHSYHFVCNNPSDVLATARHGIEFTAMVEHDNVMGTQFHPEKSHRFGMTLLKNFGAL